MFATSYKLGMGFLRRLTCLVHMIQIKCHPHCEDFLDPSAQMWGWAALSSPAWNPMLALLSWR